MKIFKRKDNGSEFSVSKDEMFSIQLNENPTTGFRWERHYSPSDAAIAFDEKSEYSLKDETQIGGGGIRIFQFKPKKSGIEYELIFRLRRAWENESAPIDECIFKVRVS
jgi:inhibitor of cysteine peptidase